VGGCQVAGAEEGYDEFDGEQEEQEARSRSTSAATATGSGMRGAYMGGSGGNAAAGGFSMGKGGGKGGGGGGLVAGTAPDVRRVVAAGQARDKAKEKNAKDKKQKFQKGLGLGGGKR
jgi:hypothetical protein